MEIYPQSSPCFEVEDLHASVDVDTADVPHGVVDALPSEQVVRVQPAPGRLADEAGRGAVTGLHRHLDQRDSHSQILLSDHCRPHHLQHYTRHQLPHFSSPGPARNSKQV